MNPKQLFAVSLLVSSALAYADSTIKFTNVTVSGVNEALTSVAYNTSDTFAAVGARGRVVTGKFDTESGSFNWVSSKAGNANLLAVASDGTRFVACGVQNVIFAEDQGAWSMLRTRVRPSKPFGNNTSVRGLAWSADGSRFVAVAQAPEISFSDKGANWRLETINNLSYAESFRAVAAVPGGGFVACGAFSTLRYTAMAPGSRPGTWMSIGAGRVGQPDLMGIAASGDGMIVAVGEQGRISIGTKVPGSFKVVQGGRGKPTLRAIADTGYPDVRFLAVGDKGNAFTRTDSGAWDAVNWTASSGGDVSTNLTGALFAKDGSLRGVGIIVGAGGTVLLAGTNPPSPVAEQTNIPTCAGSLPGTLRVYTTNSVGSELVAVDWYTNEVIPSNLIAANATAFTPTEVLEQNIDLQVRYFAVARDLRTGFVSDGTEIVVDYRARPTAFVKTTNTVCNGSSQDLEVELTGRGPKWMVTWNDGTIQTNETRQLIRTVGPTNPLLNESQQFTYWVTDIQYIESEANCSARPEDISGIARVTVNPRPTAFVKTTNTICNGGSQELQVDLTGLGPEWIVTWNDGTVQTSTSRSLVRTVSPSNPLLNEAQPFTYWVTGVLDTQADANCSSQAEDISGVALVIVNPRPTAFVNTTNTICNGNSQVIDVALTGLGPEWIVTWNDGTVQTNLTRSLVRTVSPSNPLLNEAQPFTYWVTNVLDTQSDANCSAHAEDMFGIALVTVNPRPTAFVNTTNTICNGNSQDLTVLLTGVGPKWVVTWDDGTIQTSAVRTLTRTVSPGNPLPNDLTTNAYKITGVIYDESDTTNCPALDTDIQGTGIVIVQPRPASQIVTTNTICNGNSQELTVLLTGVGPKWIVTWDDGTTQTTAVRTLTRIVSPANLLPNDLATNTYTITGLAYDESDTTNCPALDSDRNGTGIVIVQPRPASQIVTTNTICNGNSQDINVLLSGVGPKWIVTWDDGTVQTTAVRTLTRTVSPANLLPNDLATNTYTITALAYDESDTTNCPALDSDRSGTGIVIVQPRPASQIVTTNTICNGDSQNITVQLTGVGPEWVVTWDDGVIQTNSSRTLIRSVSPSNNQPNQALTNTYVITDLFYAGSETTNCPALPEDRNGSGVVIVNPHPTAALASLGTNVCEGSAVELSVSLSGIGPWVLQWSDGHAQTNDSSPALRSVVAPSLSAGDYTTNLYQVTNVTDSTACSAGDITGLAEIIVTPHPVAVVVTTNTICQGDLADLRVALTGIGPWTITWWDDVQQTTNGQVAVRSIDPQTTAMAIGTNGQGVVTYNYVLKAVTDPTVCTNSGVVGGVAKVDVRPIPTVALAVTNSDVCDAAPVHLNVSFSGVPPFTIVWEDGVTNANINSNTFSRTVLATNPSPNEIWTNRYALVMVQDASALCGASGDLGSAEFTVYPLPTATIYGDTNIYVSAKSTSVDIFWGAQLTGLSPWIVHWSDGVIETNLTGFVDRTTTTTLGTGFERTITYTITSLTSGTNPACAVVPSGSATVTITKYPQGLVEASTNSTCAGDPLTLTVTLEGKMPIEVTWWDGTKTNANSNTVTRVVAPLVSTNYSILKLKDFKNYLGESNADWTVAITVNPIPGSPVVLIPTNTVCAGTVTNLAVTVDPGNDAIWMVGGVPVYTGTTFAASSPLAGTIVYDVYQQTPAGCASVLPSNVTLISLPRPVAPTGSAIVHGCPATPVTLSVTVAPGNTARWVLAGVEVTNNSATFSAELALPGTNVYDVFEISAAGCDSATSLQVTFIVDPPTVAILTESNILCNGANSSIDFVISNGVSPWTLVWTNGFASYTQQVALPLGAALPLVTNLALDASSELQTVTFTNLTEATNLQYSIVSITDGAGCTGETPGSIIGTNTTTVSPLPALAVALVATNTVCAGAVTNLIVSVDPGNDAVWMIGGVPFYTNTQFSANPSLAGTVVFDVYQQTPAGCLSAEPIQVTLITLSVPPAPTVAIPVVYGCLGEPVTLSVGIEPGNTAVWYLGGDTVAFGSDYTTNFALPVTNVYTVYQVNAGGCISGASQIALVLAGLPSATVLDVTNNICDGDTNAVIAFTIDSGSSPWTIVWDNGLTNYTQQIALPPGATLPLVTNLALDGSSALQTATNLDGLNPATNLYWIASLTDRAACLGSFVGTNTTVIYPLPSAPTGGTAYAWLTNTEITLTVTASGTNTVYWREFGTNTVSITTNYTFTPTGAGTFWYQVFEVTPAGCAGQPLTVTLEVTNAPPVELLQALPPRR